MLNVRMDYVLFPIKQTEETMTCQNELWSLSYLKHRRDHDTFNVKMDWSLRIQQTEETMTGLMSECTVISCISTGRRDHEMYDVRVVFGLYKGFK